MESVTSCPEPDTSPLHAALSPDTFSAAAVPVKGLLPSASALRRMTADGAISPAILGIGLHILGVRPNAADWRIFLQRLLALAGGVLLAVGLVFFFAANWHALHHFSKLALLFACIAGALGVAFYAGLDSLAGRVGLLFACLVVGPLLAVYGQTYQTGAQAWELFRAWGCVLVLPALAGRQTAVCFVLWLVTATAVSLYIGPGDWQYFHHVLKSPLFWGMHLLAVALWESAAWRWGKVQAWLASRWLPRLIFFVALFFLSWAICEPLLSLSFLYGHDAGGGIFSAYFFAYLVILAGSFVWFRLKRPDLFILGVCVLSAGSVFICLCFRARLFFMDNFVLVFLLWGMLITALTAGAGKLLHVWHRSIERQRAVRTAGTKDEPARDTVPGWECIWHEARRQNMLHDEEEPVIANDSPVPWYVLAIQGIGGWVASLLLLIFLGLFVGLSLNISGDAAFRGLLLVLGGAVLVAGAVATRGKGLVARQFGLSCSLSGTGAVSVALVWGDVFSSSCWPLLAALGPLAAYFAVRSDVFRLIVAVFVCFLLHIFLGLFLWGGAYGDMYFFEPGNGDSADFSWYYLVYGIWWLALCVGMALLWLRETRWPARRGEQLIAPALHGVYLVLLLVLGNLCALQYYGDADMGLFEQPVRFLASFLGVAAGGGVIVFAFTLSRGGTSAKRGAIVAGAVLCAICGFFLPGLSLALLGLLIGRHTGHRVYLVFSGVFLFSYMLFFYYSLAQTLLYKSFSLMAAGCVCLLLAFLARRVLFVEEGAHA